MDPEELQDWVPSASEGLFSKKTVKLTIGLVTQHFLRELAELERKKLGSFRILTPTDAERIKTLMNNHGHKFRCLRDVQSYHQNWQQVDYVPSNLGNGFIFYFVCDQCQALVRNLYRPSMGDSWRCRVCHKLKYKIRPRRHKNTCNCLCKSAGNQKTAIGGSI